jgi:hypothetical protein
MKRLTVIATAAALVLFAVLSLNLAAQQPDTHDRTIMTFSNAVELPGMRLDAGMYVFRIADTPNRNVIQVLSSDEMKVLGQWLFVPAERQEVTGDTVVTFREDSAGAMPAVQYWFYPGEKIGKEFIYPKDQALRIAQRTGGAVLTEEGPVTAGAQASAAADTSSTTQEPTISAQAETQTAPAPEQTAVVVEEKGVGVVEGSGLPPETPQAEARVAPAQEQGAVAVQTEREPRPVGTSGQAAQQESTTARNELPRTASPLALSGLLGLLSLVGAGGIRLFRN